MATKPVGCHIKYALLTLIGIKLSTVSLNQKTQSKVNKVTADTITSQ